MAPEQERHQSINREDYTPLLKERQEQSESVLQPDQRSMLISRNMCCMELFPSGGWGGGDLHLWPRVFASQPSVCVWSQKRTALP